jgi:hypothetical protein
MLWQRVSNAGQRWRRLRTQWPSRLETFVPSCAMSCRVPPTDILLTRVRPLQPGNDADVEESPCPTMANDCARCPAYGMHADDGRSCPDGLVRRTSKTQQARPNVRTRKTRFRRPALRAYGAASPFGRTLRSLISNGFSPVLRPNVQEGPQTGPPRIRSQGTGAPPGGRRRCLGESATGMPPSC